MKILLDTVIVKQIEMISLSGTKKMKIVHVTLHKGCANDFASMVNHLESIDLKTYFLHAIPNRPNNIYDLTKKEVIEWIWNACKESFMEADCIVTSDTAPLARVLWHHKNEIRAKVVVWVCNRVNYFDPPNHTFSFSTYANELKQMSQAFS
jgi:hypothetical protein